jgi:hypothetical protein
MIKLVPDPILQSHIHRQTTADLAFTLPEGAVVAFGKS